MYGSMVRCNKYIYLYIYIFYIYIYIHIYLYIIFIFIIYIYRYYGEVLNNLKHGSGREFFRNKDIYEGLYANGKPNGAGVY